MLCKEKNRYFRRSHLSEAKFRAAIRYFVHDLRAWKIAELSGVKAPPSGSVNTMWFLFRNVGAGSCTSNCDAISGKVSTSWLDSERAGSKKGT